MAPRKPQAQRRREQGVALVLTLGVLALLTVLAFSFALASINSAVATKLEENLLSARLMCDSGLQLVAQRIGTDFAAREDDVCLYPATAPDLQVQVGTEANGWPERRFWTATQANPSLRDQYGLDEALYVKVAGVALTPPAITAVAPEITWVHQRHPETQDSIVSRYAYVLLDRSGMVDPGAAASAAVAEGAETNRLGTDVSEISLAAVLEDTPLAASLQHVNLPGGTLPEGLRWLSYYHIFNQDSLARGTAEADLVMQRLFPFSYDVEAYSDSGVDRHRFDLLRGQAAWDAMTVADLDTGAVEYWVRNDNPESQEEEQVREENNGGVPWLHLGLSTIRRQVMANLIDYCDTNDRPTTDWDPAAAVPSATYVGLERVPYLNEFVITARLEPKEATPTENELRIAVQAELVNLYGTAYDLTGTRLDVTVKVYYLRVEGTPEESAELTYSFLGQAGDYPSLTVAPRSYYTYGDLAQERAVDLGTLAQVRVTSVQVTRAALQRITNGSLATANDQLLDYVAGTTASAAAGVPFVDVSAESGYKGISVEVDDPRHNLPSSEWTWRGAWNTGTGLAVSSLGQRNAACEPAAGDVPPAPAPGDEAEPEPGAESLAGRTKDYEPAAVEPWEVSTAYIRNAQMTSLWELGCIHRGGTWQTLNLSVYNASASSTSGMGEYQSGDANLLDQVKMGDQIRQVGRINVNTPVLASLRGLFQGVTIASHYDPALRTDSMVDAAGATAMANAVRQLSQVSLGGDPFRNRSEATDAGALHTAWAAGIEGNLLRSDAALESVVGKTVGLMSTRQNYFMCILVAQVVKDLGAPDGRPDMLINGVYCRLGRFDPGGDRILGTQRILAVMYRDAVARKTRMERFYYLD